MLPHFIIYNKDTPICHLLILNSIMKT